jgi:C_GCAxxG_C_C family probable redox protein
MTKEEAIEKALSYFNEGYACAQSVLLTFAGEYNLDDETAKRISSTFGGGMGRLRQKCGALTSGFMVLGLACGNTRPDDMDTKLDAYKKVRSLNRSFKNIYGTTSCGAIIKKYATEAEIAERKHHTLICRKVISDSVGLLYDMLQDSSRSK